MGRGSGRLVPGGVVIIALGFFLAGPPCASAAPWSEPGDARLRADLQVLAAYGVIDRSLTTWPLPIATIARRLAHAETANLPTHAEQSLYRIKAYIDQESQTGKLRTGADLRGTTSPPARLRTFEDSARNVVDTHAHAAILFPKTALKLRAGVISDGDLDDPQLSFDGSYIAQGAGNLLFYAGTVDQWWGPGEVSSLILSNNARPFPKIGFMRNRARPFDSKYLRWLGPWQFNMFLGRLEEERTIARPLIWGMRLSFAPAQGLELGLSRILQLCGEDRPCDGGTWWRAFIGRDNEASTPEERANQPGNQLAGWDVAYSRPVGNVVARAWLQMIAEDSDTTDVFPFQFAMQAGAGLAGGIGAGRWTLDFEYADTAAREAGFAGDTRFNVFYDHFIYRTGYRYENRTIGHPLDNDGRIYSVLASYLDAWDVWYRLQYHHAEVNRDGVVRPGGIHTQSNRAGKFNLISAQAVVPLKRMEISLNLRVDDIQRFDPDADDITVAGELGLRVRF
jgi:hypothetical protein